MTKKQTAKTATHPVSFFKRSNTNKVTDVITLAVIVKLIRIGAYGLAEKIIKARAVFNPDDKTDYDIIKATLPAFVPHLFSGTRASKNISDYSGLVLLDYDGLTQDESEQLRDKVFATSPYCVMAFLSPSGRGVKALIFTDATDKDKAERTYYAVVRHYEALVNDCLGRVVPIDESGKDASRLCYLSYDPNIYYNPNAEPLTVHVTDTDPKPSKATKPSNLTSTGGKNYEYDVVKDIAKRHLIKIDFSSRDGNGRHGKLTNLAGLLNAGGVNVLVAETIFRDLLTAYGLQISYINEKITTALHSIYAQYHHQHGTRTLCETKTNIKTVTLNGAHIGADAVAFGALTQWIKDTPNGLIKANTGTGKTTAVLSIAFEILPTLSPDECIYFVTPCTMSAEQAYYDFIKRYPHAEPDTILAIGKKEGAEHWFSRFTPLEKAGVMGCKPSKIIIGTPDQLHRIQEQNAKVSGADAERIFYKVRYCFADEIHTAIAHTSFRDKMIAVSEMITDSGCKFFAITGTPEHFSDQVFPEQFHVIGDVLPDFDITFVTHFDGTVVLKNALEALRKGRKIIICWDSKKKAKWLSDQIAEHGYSVELINSDTKDSKAYTTLAENRRVEVDVIIGTNIIQDAVSIENEDQFDLHYIYEKTFADKNGLNAVKVRQFAARCRRNKYVPLTIYALHPTNPKPCKPNELRSQIAYAKFIAEGFEQVELGTNTNIYTQCTTARERFGKDGDDHLLTQWRKALENYYRSKTLMQFKADVERLFGINVKDPDDDDFTPCERLTDDLKEISKEAKANTEQVLNAIDSERVVNCIANVYGEKGLKKIQSTVYGDGRHADAVQAVQDLETLTGINKDRLLNSESLTIVRRLIYLRGRGFTHSEAVELVKEHISPNEWGKFKTGLTASLTALGERADNVVTAYDHSKDIKVVGAIKDYMNQNGNDLELDKLIEYLKERPDVEHWHHSRQKVAILLQSYFKAERVRINKGKGNNKKVWKVTGEMNLDYFLESNGIADTDGRIKRQCVQVRDNKYLITPKLDTNAEHPAEPERPTVEVPPPNPPQVERMNEPHQIRPTDRVVTLPFPHLFTGS